MKNILSAWKNKKQILEGIRNKIFTNDTVEKIATERFEEHCMKCDHRDDSGKSCLVGGTAPCCDLCGCSLKLATRSLSYTCKAGNWPIYITEEESTDLQITLNYIDHLEKLLSAGIVSEEEYTKLHEQLTSDKKYDPIEARFEIRNKLEQLKK